MENQVLLDIAKKSIEKKFDTNVKINKEKFLADFPELSKNGATFITLTIQMSLLLFLCLLEMEKTFKTL